MENDLKGNENYFELTGGSSYRGFELPRVDCNNKTFAQPINNHLQLIYINYRVNSLSKTDTFGTDPNCPFQSYFSLLHKALLKCPLSVLERCPSYREYSYSKMIEKRRGPTPGVRVREVSDKRELTECILTEN